MAKAKSCVACRVRRVRCDRDAQEEDCRNCKKRNLKCVAACQEEKRKVVNRRRLAGVERLLSNEQDGGTTSLATLLAKDGHKGLTLTELEAKFADEPEIPINQSQAPTSASDLQVAASSDTALADLQGYLVAFYFFCFHQGRYSDRPLVAFPIIQWDELEARFEGVNRQITRLSPQDQLTATVICAMSANIGDHGNLFHTAPFLLDPIQCYVHPRYTEMARYYGYARQGSCERLRRQAQMSADISGLWRFPTYDNVVLLVLLALLTGRGEMDNHDARFYLVSAVEQLRQLDPAQLQTRDNEGLGTVLVAILLDANSALSNNTHCLIPDAEILRLMKADLAHLAVWPSHKAIENIIAVESDPRKWYLVLVAYANVSLAARALVAQQRGVPFANPRERLEAFSLLHTSLLTTENTVLSALSYGLACTTSRRGHWQCHFGAAFVANVFQRMRLLGLLDHQMDHLLESDASDLKTQIEVRLQELLIKFLQHQPTNEGVDAISFGTGSAYSLADIHDLCKLVIRWPLSPAFSFPQKSAILQRLYESATKLSYSFNLDKTLRLLSDAIQLPTESAPLDRLERHSDLVSLIETEQAEITVDPSLLLI